MPVPRRDAAEQRRAARGGVGAVDRVQLDVERIGQQLPPARLDRAAAREPQRAHGRAVRANRVEPRAQRERDAFERRAHHGERSPVRYGKKLICGAAPAPNASSYAARQSG
ncbi:Uncharacterised protein [Burkholderia pseudomallei]|nr:Uncharacterised protein [Burkholderia pseudomallei]